MSFINQYLEFLKLKKEFLKINLNKETFIELLDMVVIQKEVLTLRYIFVIGRVIDKGRIKVHCLKINDIRPAIFVNFLKDLKKY